MGARRHGETIVVVKLMNSVVRDWPDLQEFLASINAVDCPIESVGCERARFPLRILPKAALRSILVHKLT